MNTLLGAITDTAPVGPMTSATTGGGVVTDIVFEGGGETMPVNLGPVLTNPPPFGGGSLEAPSEDIFVKPEALRAEETKELTEKPKKMNMLLIGGGLLLAYFLLFRKK
jgi:hypothetical protein